MYLSELDIIGISIALVSLMALVITSATANARLTRDRDYWRRWAMYDDETRSMITAKDCDCWTSGTSDCYTSCEERQHD